MSKIKDIERNFEVIAGQVEAQQMLIESIIVEAIRTKAMNEAAILTLRGGRGFSDQSLRWIV